MKHRRLYIYMLGLISGSLWSEANEIAPVIKSMQEIEPGFYPKDERSIEIFKLQEKVSATVSNTRAKIEEREKIRASLVNKFRDKLSQITKDLANELAQKQDHLTDEGIKFYETAINDYPDNSIYGANALYNLGRLYYEQDEKVFFEKLARYNEAREKGNEDVPYPEENFDRTIRTLEKLIKDHPSFPEMADVYYMLGLALWYEGAFPNAVKRFEELIKKFPESRLTEEAWFRLGEFFYDMGDYQDSINAYEKPAGNPNSPFYDQAVYKTAWAYFQIDNYMKSIENFTKIVVITSREGAKAHAVGMRDEALHFIVKNFSEKIFAEEAGKRRFTPNKSGLSAEKEYAESLGVRVTNDISSYFRRLNNPPYVRDVLLQTATQLLEESKIDGAVLALQKIIELDPEQEDAPRIATQIVEILEDAHRLEEARMEGHALIKRYNKNSPWYLYHKDNPKAQIIARDAVRDAMLSLAVYYHKAGKEKKAQGDTKNADKDFLEAATLYRESVLEFPERDDTYKAIFYLAESSYERDDFRAALDAYTFLMDYPLPMADNIRHEAIFNIVFTFRHVLEEEAKEDRFKKIDFDHLTSKMRGAEPQAIPELGLRYLAAIDHFQKLAPKDDRIPALLFHAAAIYYVYGHIGEALKRFLFIVDTYPKSQAAKVAARLVIDDAVANNDWPRVVELAKRFKEQGLEEKDKYFDKVVGGARFQLAKTVFEEAAKLKEENQLKNARAKYKEAADLFLTLLKEDPKNPHADIMLFNAARAVVESGTTTEALPLYQRLYRDYPDSTYARDAHFQVALALEKMLKFSEAAKAYDEIIKRYPDSEGSAFAMLNKALLFEADSNFQEAAKAYLDFAKIYPDREESADALLTAASLYKKLSNTNRQISMLEQFVKTYGNKPQKIPAVIEAHLEIGDSYGDLLKDTTSPKMQALYRKLQLENYRAAVKLYSPNLDSEIAAYYAAKANLILEEPEQEAFKKMGITANTGKGQADQTTAMLKKLTELAQKNEAIIKTYTQPVWNAESLRRIGALYERLAQAMLKAPCPKDVSDIDEYACDEYLVLLEDKAAVLEQKALSAYKQAYDIAITAYDAPKTLVDNILTALNRLKPGEYQRPGTLIEKTVDFPTAGQGRMLSSGRMASSLHPNEEDPDKPSKKVE